MLAEAMDSMAIETLQAHICISAGSCVYIYVHNVYIYIIYIYSKTAHTFKYYIYTCTNTHYK